MSGEITLGDLTSTTSPAPDQVRYGLLLLDHAEDKYGELVRLIHIAFDWAADQLQRNPELYRERGEDEITIDFVHMLRAMGLEVTHDTKEGGHCDIRIASFEEMLWHCEAKKKTSDLGYDWLMQGFQQLTTRYTTGAGSQSSGGLLIYCFQERIDRIMERWRAYLKDAHDGIEIEWDGAIESFFSSHEHRRTGLRYRVRHLAVSLFFHPQDH